MNIRIGPLSIPDFRKIEERLTEADIEFTVHTANSRRDSFEDNREPVVTGGGVLAQLQQWDFIFIEMDEANLPLIQKDLETMGLWHSRQPAKSPDSPNGSFPEPETLPPELEGTDFMCPDCNHTSTSEGLCPQHRTRLIEYSDWVKLKKEKDSFYERWIFRGFILAAVGFYIYLYLSGRIG